MSGLSGRAEQRARELVERLRRNGDFRTRKGWGNGGLLHEAADSLEAAERVAATLRQERDGAEKAARHEADQYMRQLDRLREENTRLQTEAATFLDVARHHKEKREEAEREAVTLRQALEEIREVVDEQAEDGGLWGIYPVGQQPIVEAYLQQELRRLHETVERAALAAAGDTEAA